MDMVPIQWELHWLLLDMSPCLNFSDTMDAWHSAAKQGKMYYKQRPDGWILNRNRQRVPFCNAFIHQRQVV